MFDLANPSDFKITRLDAPDRMVIELRPLHRPEFPGAPSLRVPRHPSTSMQPCRQAAGVGSAILLFIRRRHSRSAADSRCRAFRLRCPPIPNRSRSISPIHPGVPPCFAAREAPQLSCAPPPLRVLPAATPAAARSLRPLRSHQRTPSRSLTRALGLKVNRIVIDAGHGGHDDGTIGPHGVLEKDVVLDVALRLSKLVQQRLGAEVVLTRSDDTFIPLHERTAIANDHKADLFLSIHANSSPAPEVAGTETFFLNFTNSPDALNVAARENAGSDKTVGELKDLIQIDHPERQNRGIPHLRRRISRMQSRPRRQHSNARGPQSRREAGAVCGADRRLDALGAG